MALHSSAQIVLHARTCADVSARATRMSAFVYAQARALADAELPSQGVGARKTACGIPVRDLRLTERVLCRLSYRGTWCKDAAGAKQHIDRRARPRLGAKTIQASIGRSHHPAQLAPQRNDVTVRCRERGSDGKSSRTACLSFPKVCIRIPLAPAERARIPQLSCANPKSGERNGRTPPRARVNWSRAHVGERA